MLVDVLYEDMPGSHPTETGFAGAPPRKILTRLGGEDDSPFPSENRRLFGFDPTDWESVPVPPVIITPIQFFSGRSH